jgi:hypothetical protein
MRGLKDIYIQIISAENGKFLGFFKEKQLKLLEELLNTDLGVRDRERTGKKARTARPFIGWQENGRLNVCFLTSQKKGEKVDLRNCRRLPPECGWIKDYSYLFWSRGKGYVIFSFKEGIPCDYILCGRCRDLEFLEGLRIIEV